MKINQSNNLLAHLPGCYPGALHFSLLLTVDFYEKRCLQDSVACFIILRASTVDFYEKKMPSKFNSMLYYPRASYGRFFIRKKNCLKNSNSILDYGLSFFGRSVSGEDCFCIFFYIFEKRSASVCQKLFLRASL